MEKGKCCWCKHFCRYYTKGLTDFKACPIGLCGKRQDIVKAADGCEEFSRRLRRVHHSAALKRRLNDILINLTAIRKFVEEEERERNENKTL